MSLASLLCSVRAPEDVDQLRRIYVAPDIWTCGEECSGDTNPSSCCSSSNAAGDVVSDLLVTCNRSSLLHYQWNYTQQNLSRVIPSSSPSSSSFSSYPVSTHTTARSSCLSSLPTFVSSVRDIAWCPFKKGRRHAYVLSACRSQPLQVFNLYPSSKEEEEGEWEKKFDKNHRSPGVISVKGRSGSGGVPDDPTAVTWWRREGEASGGVAAAGYHVAESPTSIRLLDMQRILDGDGCTADAICGTYVSPLHTRSGPVSVLHAPSQDTARIAHNALSPPSTVPSSSSTLSFPFFSASSLVLAGYYRHPHVEVIDTRHCCPAVVLHASDPRRERDAAERTTSSTSAAVMPYTANNRHRSSGGVVSICTHPSKEYLVFATGRGGTDCIRCWDIRQPMAPLGYFLRPSVDGDLQRCDLAVIQAPSSLASCAASLSSPAACTAAIQAGNAMQHGDHDQIPVPAGGEAAPANISNSSSSPTTTTNTSFSSLVSCSPLEPPYVLCCTYSRRCDASSDKTSSALHSGGLSFFTTSASFLPGGITLPWKDFSRFASGPTSGLAVLPPVPPSLVSHLSPSSPVAMAVLSSRVVPSYPASPRFLSSSSSSLPTASKTSSTMYSHASDLSVSPSHGGGKHPRSRWEIRTTTDVEASDVRSESDGEEISAFYRVRCKRKYRSIENTMKAGLASRRDRKDAEGSRSSSSEEEETDDFPPPREGMHADIHVISFGG